MAGVAPPRSVDGAAAVLTAPGKDAAREADAWLTPTPIGTIPRLRTRAEIRVLRDVVNMDCLSIVGIEDLTRMAVVGPHSPC